MPLDNGYTPNLLLRAMKRGDLALLAPYLERVSLDHEQVLVSAHEPIEHVYFLEDGIASIVATTPDIGTTEIGIFGRDGLSGTAVLLGTDRTPHKTFMQVNGSSALRIEADHVREAMSLSPVLQGLLLRYAQSFIVQTGYSAIANARHRVEARLARWLLMCHDRIDSDDIALTHEFMSMMIAAQRTVVTMTLHVLEGAGMIRATRGRVTILDRDKLEDLAGDAYGEPEAEYRRLIGPFGRGNHK